MSVHLVELNVDFIVRPGILEIKTDQGFMLLFQVLTLLPLHISQLLRTVANGRLCLIVSVYVG